MIRMLDSAGSTLVELGRQQQQQQHAVRDHMNSFTLDYVYMGQRLSLSR